MKTICSNKTTAIIEADRYHMLSIIDDLRQADQDEVRAASGLEPDMGLLDSWCRSMKTWAIIHKGEVAAVMGLVRNVKEEGVGVPWMLGTDAMDEVKIFFTKQSKKFILNEMLSEFEHLVNFVDARNKKALGWLKYCGFELSKPVPFGPDGIPFHRLYINRDMMEKICATQQ